MKMGTPGYIGIYKYVDSGLKNLNVQCCQYPLLLKAEWTGMEGACGYIVLFLDYL